jgi:hypothetical protein
MIDILVYVKFTDSVKMQCDFLTNSAAYFLRGYPLSNPEFWAIMNCLSIL